LEIKYKYMKTKAIIPVIITSYFAIALYGRLRSNETANEPNPVTTAPTEEEEVLPDTTKTVEQPTAVASPPPIDSLVYAMIQVESRDNDSAYCAVEDAVGCLQIRPIMVREVNRICKILDIEETYTLQDRWTRSKSIEMLKIFARFYDLKEFEEVARCWNGGPSGMTYASTEGYWNRVQNEMI